MTFSDFKKKYAIRLTSQQEAAVLRTDGCTLLLAVPGSGKTTVIVSRIGYMTECCNISHGSILTLTYSVAACRDMKERYISVFGDKNVPQFRTIHGLCALIIKEYERLTGSTAFDLSDNETRANDILTEVYRKVYRTNPDIGSINELKKHIGYIRNMMLTNDEIGEYSEDEQLLSVIREYKDLKTKLKLMDYDDQLEFAYIILRKYPSVLKHFKNRFTYINVDEAQDTSKLQHEIIRLITGKNLFMVGDEDQSIYGFRAAFPEALLSFDKTYPGAEILLMEQNFRSTGKITEKALGLINHNSLRHKKNMFTDNAPGDDIKTIDLRTYSEQFGYLSKVCLGALSSGETSAILFRNNESVIPLIDILERRNISYKIRENDCLYFSNPCIKDVLLMLSFCENPDNCNIFTSIAPRMGCGLSYKSALKICEDSVKNNRSVYNELKKAIYSGSDRGSACASLFDVIDNYSTRTISDNIFLLHSNTCFGRFLDHRFGDKLKIAVLFLIASKCSGLDDLLQRLEFLRERMLYGNTHNKNCITLSTIHSSKGLEFDNVYLIDIKDGILPGTPGTKSDSDERTRFLEEERRLFYVGVTRARKRVIPIMYNFEYDGSRAETSSFIRELLDRKESIFSAIGKKVGDVKTKKTSHDVYKTFKQGMYIRHKTFGKGKILRVCDDICTVQFETGKKKQLSLEICINADIIHIINN